MPTSPYIHHYRDIGEQGLIQSITAETIYLGGRDVIYLPREDYNREDAIFGQATQLVFRQAVNVAMMLESTEGFEGEGEFYSKFGLDIKDRVTLSLSRLTWEGLNMESASPTQITNREDADGFDRLLLELAVRYTTQEDNLIAENFDRLVAEDTENAYMTRLDDLVLEVQDLDLGIDRPIAEDSGGTRDVNIIDEESGAGGPFGEIAYVTMEEEDVPGQTMQVPPPPLPLREKPMDLFKAIFEDSDDETEEDESSLDEEEKSKEREVNEEEEETNDKLMPPPKFIPRQKKNVDAPPLQPSTEEEEKPPVFLGSSAFGKNKRTKKRSSEDYTDDDRRRKRSKKSDKKKKKEKKKKKKKKRNRDKEKKRRKKRSRHDDTSSSSSFSSSDSDSDSYSSS